MFLSRTFIFSVLVLFVAVLCRVSLSDITNTWVQTANLAHPIADASLVTWGGSLFALGGCQETQNCGAGTQGILLYSLLCPEEIPLEGTLDVEPIRGHSAAVFGTVKHHHSHSAKLFIARSCATFIQDGVVQSSSNNRKSTSGFTDDIMQLYKRIDMIDLLDVDNAFGGAALGKSCSGVHPENIRIPTQRDYARTSVTVVNATCVSDGSRMFIAGGAQLFENGTIAARNDVDLVDFSRPPEDKKFYTSRIFSLDTRINEECMEGTAWHTMSAVADANSVVVAIPCTEKNTSRRTIRFMGASPAANTNSDNTEVDTDDDSDDIPNYRYSTFTLPDIAVPNDDLTTTPEMALFEGTLFIFTGNYSLRYSLDISSNVAMPVPHVTDNWNSVALADSSVVAAPLTDVFEPSKEEPMLYFYSFGGHDANGELVDTVQRVGMSSSSGRFLPGVLYVKQGNTTVWSSGVDGPHEPLPVRELLHVHLSWLVDPATNATVRLSSSPDCATPIQDDVPLNQSAAPPLFSIVIEHDAEMLFFCVSRSRFLGTQKIFVAINLIGLPTERSSASPKSVWSTSRAIILLTCGGVILLFVLIPIAVRYYLKRNKLIMYLSMPHREQVARMNIESANKFMVLKKLGAGGNGEVFLVRRKADREVFAVKHVKVAGVQGRDESLRETDLINDFKNHPNIVRVFEMSLNEIYAVIDPTEGTAAMLAKAISAARERRRRAAAAGVSETPGGGYSHNTTETATNNASSHDFAGVLSKNYRDEEKPLLFGDTTPENGRSPEGNGAVWSTTITADDGHSSCGGTVYPYKSHGVATVSSPRTAKAKLVRFQCIVMEFYKKGDLASWLARATKKGGEIANHCNNNNNNIVGYESRSSVLSLQKETSRLGSSLAPPSIPGAPGSSTSVVVPEPVIVSVALQMLAVLHGLHTHKPHPVAHSDMKLENILVAEKIHSDYCGSGPPPTLVKTLRTGAASRNGATVLQQLHNNTASTGNITRGSDATATSTDAQARTSTNGDGVSRTSLESHVTDPAKVWSKQIIQRLSYNNGSPTSTNANGTSSIPIPTSHNINNNNNSGNCAATPPSSYSQSRISSALGAATAAVADTTRISTNNNNINNSNPPRSSEEAYASTFLPVVLTDLALAVVIPAHHTTEDMSLHAFTLPYVAPECMATGLKCVSTKIDIWALGCVCYFMASGKFDGTEWVTSQVLPSAQKVDVLLFEKAQDPDFHESIRRELVQERGYSASFTEFVVKMLAIAPSQRPTAADLLSQIKRVGMYEYAIMGEDEVQQ